MTGGTDRNYVLIATLIAAAAIGTWLTLAAYQRSSGPSAGGAAVPGGAAASLAAHVSPPAALTPPAAAQPDPVEPAGAVAVSATGELTDTTQPDQRQVAKITRGLSANPGGGILVDATAAAGSVTGQLGLRAGDVIVSVNGDPISSPTEFARIYREQGLPAQLTILRNGREIHRH